MPEQSSGQAFDLWLVLSGVSQLGREFKRIESLLGCEVSKELKLVIAISPSPL